ncbi:MAG: hypothetical protein U1F77_05395 [Kiritimatiellia bacterium]
MNGPVLQPDLQSCLMCDDVRQEMNGKFILIGIVDTLGCATLPMRHPRFFVVTRWCNGQGVFTQKTRILKPDQQSLLASGQDIPVRLNDPVSTATNIELFVNSTFTEPGTHWIEVLLDGEMMVRTPLRVHLVKPSGQQAAPPAPPPDPPPSYPHHD